MKSFNSYLSGAGFVMYSKEVAHLTTPEAAILYGQLISWSEHKIETDDILVKDGKIFFAIIQDDLVLETGLSKRRIRPAVDQLIEIGALEMQKIGFPKSNHYHIVEGRMFELLREYEGTRKQRLKQIRAKRLAAIRAAKKAEREAKKAAAAAAKPKKAAAKQRQAKPVEAAPVAPGIDDLLPSGMDQQQQPQAAAPGMTLTEILRDDQLGAIFEYIEVTYNQSMPVKLTADEIAEICSYIRKETKYKKFDPLDIDQAFYELAAMEPSQVSKPTHFLGGAIAKAAGRRKLVNYAKSSNAAANKNRGELVEYLRAKDPNHVLVKRYDEEMKSFTK